MKLICIWRNIENKKGNKPEPPVFYFKPETTLLLNSRPFYFPEFSEEITCSLQVVLRINKAGKHIQEKFAHTYYDEIGLGMNLTATDILKDCIKNHIPTDKAYCFDGSSPLSGFINRKELGEESKELGVKYHLNVNDKTHSEFHSNDLLFSFDKIISFVSEYMMLKTGDLLFTGPVDKPVKIKIGDEIEGFLNGKRMVRMEVK